MEDIQILEQHAVEAAVNFQWKPATQLNKKILDLDKHNLSAHLRLGFIYLQLQKFDLAKKYYRKALKIQPNSNVAKENLERIQVLRYESVKKNKKTHIYLNPNLFLESTGKTKNVTLVNLGQKNILASLSVSQEVLLIPKKRKIEVRTKEKEYIGSLPDDLSKRLIVFIKAKSIYLTYIKEAGFNKVTVFIREEKKGKKVQQFLSFPHNIQAHMNEIQAEKESTEEQEDILDNDLEKLAESLTTEEKDYIPFHPDSDEEESEE